MGCVLEANELQPGLVPSHCYLPSTQKVTVRDVLPVLPTAKQMCIFLQRQQDPIILAATPRLDISTTTCIWRQCL